MICFISFISVGGDNNEEYEKGITVLLVILLVVTAVPLNGFVGIELPDFFSFKAKAETNSNEFLTSGFCGDTSEGGDGKNISWELDDNGLLTITGTGKMAPNAFEYDLRIKEVVISDGITNISSYCFNECENITKVTMGDDIEVIESYAFYDCDLLADVEFSDSLISIEGYAFYSCNGLTTLDLPDLLETIGEHAFHACDWHTSINFSDSFYHRRCFFSNVRFYWTCSLFSAVSILLKKVISQSLLNEFNL